MIKKITDSYCDWCTIDIEEGEECYIGDDGETICRNCIEQNMDEEE